MTADIVIRDTETADLPAVTAIYAHAVDHGTASFETSPPDLAEMTTRFATLHEGGFPHLVAERDGAVLGYAYAGPYRPRPAYRFTVEDSIYLAPGAQGQGIGRSLLEALITDATARGFRQMIAVISDSASAPSIALHQAAGFDHVGTFKAVGHKHAAWRDTVLMQRALGEGDASSPEKG